MKVKECPFKKEVRRIYRDVEGVERLPTHFKETHVGTVECFMECTKDKCMAWIKKTERCKLIPQRRTR